MLSYRLLSRFLVLLFSVALMTSPVYAATHDALMQRKVNQLVLPYMAVNDVPGVAIAIYYRGNDYFYDYGFANRETQQPVTRDTIFELASITKIFTTTLLASEIKDGRIQLNDHIINYLPALKSTQHLPIDEVKVVNLATHTASFPRDITQFGIQKGDDNVLMQRLKTWHPASRIGTAYLYSNIGFGLLGKVVEGAGERDFSELLKLKVTGPLDMQNTLITVPKAKWPLQAQGYRKNARPAPFYVPYNLVGGGAMRSSSADLLKFMKANLGIHANKATAELISAMQLARQPFYEVRPEFVMGLGWQRIQRNGDLYITKNGGNQGFSTFMGFSPASKFGVVVLANKQGGKASQLGNRILNQLAAMDENKS